MPLHLPALPRRNFLRTSVAGAAALLAGRSLRRRLLAVGSTRWTCAPWMPSRPPIVRAKLDKKAYRAGDTVQLSAGASAATRTISARMYGAAPVALRWNEAAKTNTGRIVLPSGIAPGRYTITITAEDMAHNIGSQEVALDVLP